MAATGGFGVIRFDGHAQIWPSKDPMPHLTIKAILIDTPGTGTYSLRLGSITGTVLWSATIPAGWDGKPVMFEPLTATSGGGRLYWDASLGSTAVAYLYVE